MLYLCGRKGERLAKQHMGIDKMTNIHSPRQQDLHYHRTRGEIMKGALEYTEHGWRVAADTTRHHRERKWDYKGRGIYHFTMTVAERYPLFGELVGDSPEKAYVDLNEFGKEVLTIMQNLPRFYAPKGYAIKILATMIMPDHIHLVLQVLESLPHSVGIIMRGFKSTCSATYKRMYVNGDNNVAEVHDEHTTHNDSIVHFARIFASTGSIWEKVLSRYHECILQKEGQLRCMIDYVHANPRRLALKRAKPDLYELPEVVSQVTAKTGDIPHDALRYRFVALNVIASLLAPSLE